MHVTICKYDGIKFKQSGLSSGFELDCFTLLIYCFTYYRICRNYFYILQWGEVCVMLTLCKKKYSCYTVCRRITFVK